MGIIKMLLADVWPYLAGAIVVVLGWIAGKRQGRAQLELQQAKALAEQQRKINAADEKIIKMADSDIRNELAKFVRKR